MKRFLIYLVLLLQTFFAACAFAAPSIPPRPTGSGIYVQDYAGIINAADKQQMLSTGRDLDNKTTAQLAVVTINSLEGQPIEDYALAVLREWGVGSKTKNNGVLIVVAIKDKVSRIEVGYGLEGVLPDGKTGRIQDKYMLPYFKQGDYSKGITQGYLATASVIAQSEGVQLANGSSAAAVQPKGSQAKGSFGLSDILIALIVIGVLIVDNMFLGGMLTQMLLWLLFFGGRGGGRGGGFGGGSGGGGGSSRHW